jgi:SAM-dependent methyltransferase
MTGDAKPEYFGRDLEAMSFARNYHEWVLAEIAPYLGRSVAEVGAGVGSFSALLLGTGIERLRAFEPSNNMYPVLRDALASDPRAAAVNDFFQPETAGGRFDSIVYVNVLEHIEDDAAELGRAREALNPGGHVLVFVPALPWLYSELDRQVGHFRRYWKGPLLDLVRESGLEIVKARYFDIAGILPWYVNFVLFKNSIGGASVSLYDRVVVPIMRVLEGVLRPPVGKNVVLVARRN